MKHKEGGTVREKMKILCVCSAGINRSGGMAYILKKNGQDALTVGADRNTPETINMLSQWADRIVVMEPKFKSYIPEPFRKKVRICDVGEDIYGSPTHHWLIKKVEKFVAEWEQSDYA